MSKIGHIVKMTAADRQRRNIIAATLGLIEGRGLSALSLSEIAAASGVSRQTVYNHFADTSAVIEAALDMHGEAMLGLVTDRMAAAPAPRAKIVALACFMIESADPAHEALPLEAGLSAEARARLERHTEALRARIAEALGGGAAQDPVRADLIWSVIEAASKTAARHPAHKDRLLEKLICAVDAIM